MGKVSESLIEEVKGLSVNEAFKLYTNLFDTIKNIESKSKKSSKTRKGVKK